MKKIDEATDIVWLLTHHSVGKPWILYEAGVAKGSNVSECIIGINYKWWHEL